VKKSFLILMVLSLLTTATGPAARADDLSYAIQIALKGPDTKGLEILGHDWNVKHATVLRQGSKTIIFGRLSHRIRFSLDDQLNYTIVKRGDTILSQELKIERRNNFESLRSFSAPVSVAIAATTGVPIPPSAVGATLNMLNGVALGGWRDAAAMIVRAIGISVH